MPCAIVLGSACSLCLVAGLVEIQRLADHRALAGLTAMYYALAYPGFAARYLIVLERAGQPGAQADLDHAAVDPAAVAALYARYDSELVAD